MGAELLVIFLIAGAVRGLVKQTKRDLARWRTRPPAPKGTKWWNKPVTATGTGYWGHQALHGFPSARHGAAAGYHQARKAHLDAKHAREKARAETDEHHARTRPEIDDFRARRRAALELIEQQQADREEQEHRDYLALLEARRLRDEARRRREAERADAERAQEPEAEKPAEPEDPPDPPEDEAPADAETSGTPEDDEKPEDPAADWDDPLPGEEGTESQGKEGTTMADEFDVNDRGGSGWLGPAGGGGGGGDTTYASVKAQMQQTVTDAEQRQAEAQESVQATEEHLAWVQDAKSRASTMADEMQALEVDPATLGAMSEHLEALDAAEKAAIDLRDQAVLNKEAWDRVLETAQQVVNQLEASGHGNLDEAHAAAAGGGAKKDFYGEG